MLVFRPSVSVLLKSTLVCCGGKRVNSGGSAPESTVLIFSVSVFAVSFRHPKINTGTQHNTAIGVLKMRIMFGSKGKQKDQASRHLKEQASRHLGGCLDASVLASLQRTRDGQ